MNKDSIYQHHIELIIQAFIELNPLNYDVNVYENYYYIIEKFLNDLSKNINLIKYLSNYLNIKDLLNSYEIDHMPDEIYQKLSKRINYYLSYLDIYTIYNDKIKISPDELLCTIHNDFIITFKKYTIYINNKLYKTFNTDIYTHTEILEELKNNLNLMINNDDLIYIEYSIPHYDMSNPLEKSYICIVDSKQNIYEDIPHKSDVNKIFNNKRIIKNIN